MPRYEYACVECDYTVELSRTVHDDTPVPCRVCSTVMRKVYTPVPTVFKTNGFYSKEK